MISHENQDGAFRTKEPAYRGGDSWSRSRREKAVAGFRQDQPTGSLQVAEIPGA